MFEKQITFDRFVRGFLLVLLGVATIWLLDTLSKVLLPFFIAWIIAYMLYPMISFLQYRLHFKSRILCIILTLLFIGAIITSVVMLIVPSIIEEYHKLITLVQGFLNNTSRNTTIPAVVDQFIHRNFTEYKVMHFLEHEDWMGAIKEMVPRIWDVLYKTVNILLSIIASMIVLLYMFFILLDYEKLSNGWIKFVPQQNRAFIGTLVNDVKVGMNKYFRGQALLSLCVGILFAIGFTLIGFPMAIVMGILIGLMNMVPYLHTFGLIPTVLLSLLKAADTGENFWVILASALAVWVVVQLLLDMVLTPKIMGKIMGLSPAVILLSLSVWGALLGMIGIIIALPLTNLCIAYYRRYILKDEPMIEPEILEELEEVSQTTE